MQEEKSQNKKARLEPTKPHHCESCRMEFPCRGEIENLPNHCYCVQEIGVSARHGGEQLQLLHYCCFNCRDVDMGDITEEEEYDEPQDSTFRPELCFQNKRKLW